MYIKNIILDGFKSYGRRVEINRFDPEFNAITGLNGTGKSNILDSICFVLGITNLVQVRATSLQDLVYKSGQAGITKATVTIVFDNSDPKSCPIGFDNNKEISITRQVIVGGKNKYLINGKAVLNKKVQDLFCSVQLNVNNPNFLIMQGRVTKVLNMKPNEILSMIEEAAGTGMYEAKREITFKQLERKEAKLKDMEALARDEIAPQLEKLRNERAAFLEYKKVCSDVDFLTRIHISYKYLQTKKSLEECTTSIQNLEASIVEDNQKISDNKTEIGNIEQQVVEMQSIIDEQSGGELQKLDAELENVSKSHASSKAELNSAKDKITSEKRKLKNIEKGLRDDEVALKSKEDEMGRVGNMFEGLKEDDAADQQALAVAEKRFEAISNGLSTNEDGEMVSLQDQLMNARSKLSEASTTIKQSDNEIKQFSLRLRSKQNESQTSDADYTKNKTMSDKMQKDIDRMKSELSQIQYEPGSLEGLLEERSNISLDARKIKAELDKCGWNRYTVQYQDPVPNFDRNKVKGMLCKLFDVKDSKYCLSLQLTAGGALYNVVTETDQISKLILEKGNLQRRTTFIPINKISGRYIDANIVRFAESLVGKENVTPAISMITYDKYLEPVMKYAFGSTLICRDMDIATKVCYHPKIMTRCVTLDGDIVDPSGALDGGSAPKGNPVLAEVAHIKQLEARFKVKQVQLEQAIAEVEKIENIAKHFNETNDKLELLKVEHNKVQQRLAMTSYQQHQTEIEELTTKVEELKQKVVDARQTQDREKEKVKDIELKLKDSKGHRERELKKAEQDLKVAKKKSDDSRQKWKKREQEYETLKLEIEELIKSVATTNEQIIALKKLIVDLENHLEAMQSGCAESSTLVESIKAKIKEQTAKINQQHRELTQKNNLKEKLGKQIQELLVGIKKKENEIKSIRNENKDALGRLKSLEHKYDWIADEKETFGVPNSRYDYSKEDPVQAGKKLTKLIEQKEKLGRNINQKAMELLEQQEKRFADMNLKIKRVQNDRDKIHKTIQNLDERKRQEVKKAWNDVNQNFGSIFSTLLPGANAKLQQPENMQYYEGLEVKVSFNGLWKEHLTELSGGQRSLVALSLILAMLKFKPAPLYILDEVDAALDLSHTQNIGNMLKAHFKNSQFIVVSLKDGMFNNANVLFRTSFVDGMSAVIRTDNVRNKSK